MANKHSQSAFAAVLALGSGLLLIRQGIGRKGLLGLADILLGAAAIHQWLYAEPTQSSRRAELASRENADAEKALVKSATLLKTPFQSS